MLRRKIAAVVLSIIIIPSSYAIVIRHDVDEKKYTALAGASYLRPGLVITRPDAPVPGCGVLIHKSFILTAGHVGSVHGPSEMAVKFIGKKYIIDHVYLFPGYDADKLTSSGNDIAILHIKGDGITEANPAGIWTGGIIKGDIIQGIGQGKSGTGKDNNEPLPAGTFRAYENTVDIILHPEHYNMLITDFDGTDNTGNSLATDIYFTNEKITGDSSPTPLPLEGTVAAGDSGSGIWIEKKGGFYLAGIATGRFYSCYYAQSMYVNLSNKAIYSWIRSIIPDISFVK